MPTDIIDIPTIPNWEASSEDRFTIELDGGQYITLQVRFEDRTYSGIGGMTMVLVGERSGCATRDNIEFTWTSEEFEVFTLTRPDLTLLSQNILSGLGRNEVTGYARVWMLRSLIESGFEVYEEAHAVLEKWAAVQLVD